MLAYFKSHKRWIIPVFSMILFTPFSAYLDLTIARYFYEQGAGNATHFPSNSLLDFMYVYALVPGQITAVIALFALLCSYLFPKAKTWRSPAMALVLILAIGGGIIVHSLLKDHWGRPRPRQTIEFGGHQEFRPYYKPNFFNQPEPSKSFPCGHCVMGFYFFGCALVAAKYNRKVLYYLSMAAALLLGIALSLTRMAQGGHFLSDVLMSALVMWLTSLTVVWIIYDWTD